MNTVGIINGRARVVLATLAISAGFTLTGLSAYPQEPGGSSTTLRKRDSAPSEADKTKEAGKTYVLEMSNKPWRQVFEWLADETGMPVITGGSDMPSGTFSYIAPKNSKTRLTMAQVIDTINDKLIDQKWILLRQSHSYTLVGSEKAIDPAKVQRVLPSELDNFGKSELVSVVLPVPGMSAKDVQPELDKMKGPFGTVTALPAINKLLIQDTVGNIRRIQEMIKEMSAQPVLIPLNTLDSTKAVESLKKAFPGEPKDGAPYIEADTNRNAVIVKGSENQIAEVKKYLAAIGEGGSDKGTSNRLSVTIPQGNAGALAEELQKAIEKLRGNPVKVQILETGGGEKKPDTAPTKPAKKDDQGGSEEQEPREQADPQPPASAQPKPSANRAPVTITAMGNRLTITSDDPEALRLASEIVRFMTSTPSEQADFEVIKLNTASATEAARILDEAYNGQKENAPGPFNRGGGNRGGFPFVFPGQQPAAPPKEPRIRVVADPSTNSILIKASPLDMLSIKRLLSRAIDSKDTAGAMKTYMLPKLKYANVLEVYSTLRDVYHEYINNNSAGANGGGLRGAFLGAIRGPQQNFDPNGNPRGVLLSMAVDERSNQLIVQCSEAMYKDILSLVEKLDDAAKDSTKTIKIVSIKGIDPTLVQQAIDAMQGRRTNTNRGGGFAGGPPFGGGGGFNGGGGGGGRGFNGGGGGGFNGGGGGRGFNPGGGGGFGGGRGGGPNMGRAQSRGPDFFEDRVTDDPQPSILYDPQASSNDDTSRRNDAATGNVITSSPGVELVGFQQPQVGPGDNSVTGPRGNVTADALPELGVVVITGNTPADVEEVVRIIELIQKLGSGAEVEIQVVPLEWADATSLATTLTVLFQRILINANSTTRSTQPIQGGGGGAQGQFGQAGGGTNAAASVTLLPFARFNAILVAAPKARMNDILREIKRFDRPPTKEGRPAYFPLKKASASRVANLINNFYASRYPGDAATTHQTRITYEDSTNTVIVQAAPADMDEIRDLIERIDSMASSATNELRIIHLKTALSDELANLLIQAISVGIVSPTGTPGIAAPTGTGGAGGGALGGAGGGLAGGGLAGGAGGGFAGGGLAGGAGGAGGGFAGGGLGGGGLGGAGGAGGGFAGGGLGGAGGGLGGARPATGSTSAATIATTPVVTQSTGTTKTIQLRFIRDGKPAIDSWILEDVHITSDSRLNSLILAAPARTMQLLLALIQELDVPPTAVANVKVFHLHKADANQVSVILQQLFFGAAGTTGATGGGGGGGGALGGTAGATVTASTGSPSGGVGMPTARFTVSGLSPEGAPLTALHISVDIGTNSLIVAGGRNDLDVVEALVDNLENGDRQFRRQEVFQLHNANAADLATSLTTFLNGSLSVLSSAGQLAPFQIVQQEAIVVAEPFTNQLLISATPKYFSELVDLIRKVDTPQPQVVIQVLVAEVDLSSTDEFGIEVGLQSPVLFTRSIVPATGFGTGSTTSYTSTTGGLVSPGVSVSGTTNPVAQPGFNFNTLTSPLGNNPVVGPGIVGFQGLGNYGVGTSDANGLGGFVFSAASNTFNLLIRALRTNGRIDVLSRPQIMTSNNQTATINIGQQYPIITSSTVTATGLVTNSIDRPTVGVILTVTPQISPDGTVLMRVTPTVSSVVNTPIALSSTVNAVAFNIQQVDTTVMARDGETVMLGGLISKSENKQENKIPIMGDLPYVGALFRYRTMIRSKSELIVIMTPRIVRSPVERAQILAEEENRMRWKACDVVNVHGTTGVPETDAACIPGLPCAQPEFPFELPPARLSPAPATGTVAPSAGPVTAPVLNPAPTIVPGTNVPAAPVIPPPPGSSLPPEVSLPQAPYPQDPAIRSGSVRYDPASAGNRN